MAKIIEFPSSESMPDRDAQYAAQELVYTAWESASSATRKRLARQALEIDHLCADAYNVLAEEYQSIKRKLEYYEKGIEVFHRRYGPDFFDEHRGHFWLEVDARPFMRLSAGLGQVLWETEFYDEAIQIYETLLELNPADNQGLRYYLLNWCLELNILDVAKTILKEYKEESTFMRFSELLFLVKSKASAKKIKEMFKKAHEANPYVLDYLLGKKALPESVPEFYTPGDETEAILYASDAELAWASDVDTFTLLDDLWELLMND